MWHRMIRKTILLAVASLFAARGVSAQHELEVRLGYAAAQSSGSSEFDYNWNGGLLADVRERGTLTQKPGSGGSFGLAYTYTFSPGLGIQARFDRLSASLSGESDYAIDWRWSSGRSGSRSAQLSGLQGDLTRSPVSLDLVKTFGQNSGLQPFVSGGVSYFAAKASAQATTGYGVTAVGGGFQFIDYWEVPVKVDGSMSSVGFNAGLGGSIALSDRLALILDARYFKAGKQSLRWEAQQGRHEGALGNIDGQFGADDVEFLEEALSPLQVDPSFFQASLGLKYRLGR
jgi:opacity protein-like surface antigen